MTATQDPNLPSSEIITAAREQGIALAQQRLNAAWAFIEQLPEELRQEAQVAIMGTWETVQMMGDQWGETQELLQRSLALVEAQSLTLTEISTQRDRVLDQMSELVNAMQTRDLHHPIISRLYSKLYGEIVEEHNAAFWESLPYDIAEVMGDTWEHVDASLLTDLVSGGDGDEESFAEDNGWTIEQVQQAKAKILVAVRELSTAQCMVY